MPCSGKTTELGNLGGVAWNTPMAINERGDIVGVSNISKDDGAAFNARAFLWTWGRGIQDLGTLALPRHLFGQALGINEQGQVVGLSCTAGFASCRAFIWQKGVMMDLNTLVPGYANHLYYAGDINDAGEITGLATKEGSDEQIAFLAVPTDGKSEASSVTSASKPFMLPADVKQRLLQRLGLSGAQLVKGGIK